MSEDREGDPQGCSRVLIWFIAGPLSFGAMQVLYSSMTLHDPAFFYFGIIALLFLIGLFEGTLRKNSRDEEGIIQKSALVGYAFLFTFAQCVILLGLLFGACIALLSGL